MKYNFALYMVHYNNHVEQLEVMRNIGDVTELSNLEMTKLAYGVECL